MRELCWKEGRREKGFMTVELMLKINNLPDGEHRKVYHAESLARTDTWQRQCSAF